MYAKFPIFQSNNKNFVVVPRGTHGIVVWGPYQTLGPGDYDVTFDIQARDYESRDEVCCTVEVAADFGREIILERRLLVADVLASGGRVRECFEAKKQLNAEYRVRAEGGVSFTIGYHRKAYPTAMRGQPLPLEDNPVYTANTNQIFALEETGVSFVAEGDRLLATIDGVTLEVRGAEDLQVIGEVFLSNEYNVIPPRPSVAIDVGMNVGITSLALAKNPAIVTVFAYEPFLVPFNRALENFARNPDCSAKVQPMNFGLSDKDQVLEVKSDPTSTIGVSIRGLTSGNPECITIKDAAVELGPKIEAAVRRGLGVVAKIDCEGSEFAIFESLNRAALFDKIDVFMIEWHKWWSPQMTQANLIAPLAEAGFFIFDRTNPLNPYAGFLHAVRASTRDRTWAMRRFLNRRR